MNVTSLHYKQILGIIILSTHMAQAAVPPPPPASPETSILEVPPAPTANPVVTPPVPPPAPNATASTPAVVPPPAPPVDPAVSAPAIVPPPAPVTEPAPAVVLPPAPPADPAVSTPAIVPPPAPITEPTPPPPTTPAPPAPAAIPSASATPVATTGTPPGPAAAPTPAATATVSVPAFATVPAPSYKAEVDEINTLLQSITATKNHMKELLTSVDADINTAKGLAAEARKKSLDVLKQGSEDAAKGIDTDIEQKLVTITDLRKKVIEATTKSFQEDTEKIQQNIKKITGIIQQLKAKGASFEAAQAQAVKAADLAAATETKQLPASWAIKSNTTNTKTMGATQEPTMIHYIFHHIASAISKVLRIFYIIFRSCKEAIWNNPAPMAATPIAGAAPAAIGSAPTQAQPTPAAPTMPSKYSFAAHEDGVAALEDAQNNMVQAAHSLEQQINLLGHTLASNKAVGQAIQSDLTLFTPVHQRPAWRQMTETYFGQCLDGVTWLYRNVQQTTARAYHTYVEPVFNKVQHDVEKERSTKPIAQQKKATAMQKIPQ